MGKYLGVPGCAWCQALGEMCLDCAHSWKLTHVDDELQMLRRLAKNAEDGNYAKVEEPLAKWRKHRRAKPPAKRTTQARSGK